MQNAEAQSEEREVLLSIYDGDPAFRELSPTTYQYKYGDEGDPKSFLLEIKWGENYPEDAPTINMDTFYNKHLLSNVRAHVVEEVLKEAANNLGFAMTFTLFEWTKEHTTELMNCQPDSLIVESVSKIAISEESESNRSASQTSAPKVKKEVLSKSQKRKQWNRLDKGEKPRGHDWVDVIKHLSQTGGKENASSTAPIPAS